VYDLVNTSHEIFDLAETWGESHEISNATGSNSGYWFLGTLSVSNPNYNGFPCTHYLPADRVDSFVDMINRCKSSSPDRLLRIYQQ
jgi:hypothetical protein